jgi:protein MpaA
LTPHPHEDRDRKVNPSMWDTMKSRTAVKTGLGPPMLALLLFLATKGQAQPAPTQETFGQSVERRPLVAYVFGHGPNVTMILGGFHNDEPASAPVVEMLGRYLALHPEEWKGRTVVLVPRVNPDGRRLRSRVNANGVDLNRNFPGTWHMIAAAARYNPGPAPASEPETRAVMRLVEKYAPSKIVSIHQPFHTLNWNGTNGRAIAEEMSWYNGYPVTGDIGYPTPGSFGSYAESRGMGIVTLEMPVVDAATCWLQNRDALLAAIRMEVGE